MSRKGHTTEQIVNKLRQADAERVEPVLGADLMLGQPSTRHARRSLTSSSAWT